MECKREKNRKYTERRKTVWAAILAAMLICTESFAVNASYEIAAPPQKTKEVYPEKQADNVVDEGKKVAADYQAYEKRFERITTIEDIVREGYEVVEKHVFDVPLVVKEEEEGKTEARVVRPTELYDISREDEIFYQDVPTVRFYTAIDSITHRAAVFLADRQGQIVYKNNRLECNYAVLGQVEQPIEDMVSVAFSDLNNDGLTDITLIAGCTVENGEGMQKNGKIGEVLFQTPGKEVSFYRDWRINDKINRFGMNKSAKCIRSFVRDGNSTEFLYTATMEEELLRNGFEVIEEQSYWRNYEKLGRLKVLPGIYSMGDYDIFMIYMINEQGNIYCCFQPMGDYDNLYSLRGISGRDLDGDGMKDLLVVARYSREGEDGELIVEGQYSIYYQRTEGFVEDSEFAAGNPYQDTDTVEAFVNKIRTYWGWNPENVILKEKEIQ